MYYLWCECISFLFLNKSDDLSNLRADITILADMAEWCFWRAIAACCSLQSTTNSSSAAGKPSRPI
jgi:hypothetical protein